MNAIGYRTRYYICSTHHNGDHERCPNRYKIPAEAVEQHFLALIKRDLLKLADDPQLQEYIAEEIARLSGNDDDARQQLQRRLAELDQQTAKLRDHLKALDAVTAQALGLYDEAKTAAEEHQKVEAELHRRQQKLPQLPDMQDIAERSRQEIERLDDIFASGTVDQKKEFVAIYVKTIEADPNAKSVKISLFPALFTQIIAGGGFAAAICETQWHNSQQAETHPDGSAILDFTVDGFDEIVWWILGLGPQCRVLQPPELAAKVRDLAAQTAELYTVARAEKRVSLTTVCRCTRQLQKNLKENLQSRHIGL